MIIIDFSKFGSIPVALQKRDSMDLKACESLKDPFKIIKTSSINKIWVIDDISEICTPTREPSSLPFLISLLNPSIMSRKSNGERGKPCVSPRST